MKPQFLRPDLRTGFVHAYDYKDHRIEVYMVITNNIHVPKGKRKPVTIHHVHAVSYTQLLKLPSHNSETTGESTYYDQGFVGFDSAHGWYIETNDSEQFKHIGSVMSQAEHYIDKVTR